MWDYQFFYCFEFIIHLDMGKLSYVKSPLIRGHMEGKKSAWEVSASMHDQAHPMARLI